VVVGDYVLKFPTFLKNIFNMLLCIAVEQREESIPGARAGGGGDKCVIGALFFTAFQHNTILVF